MKKYRNLWFFYSIDGNTNYRGDRGKIDGKILPSGKSASQKTKQNKIFPIAIKGYMSWFLDKTGVDKIILMSGLLILISFVEI